MKNLLKLEFRKMSRKLSFFICAGGSLVLLIWVAVAEKVLLDEFDISIYTVYASDIAVSQLIGASEYGLFTTFLCVLISLYVCEDYSRKTIKNILARGYTREQVYFAKLITSFVVMTVIYVVLLITAFFLNLRALSNSVNVPWKQILSHWGAQYLVLLGYTALYYALASLYGKNGGAISTGVLLPLIIIIVLPLEAYDYWLGTYASDLSYLKMESGRLTESLWVSMVYVAASVPLGYLGVRWRKY